MGTINYKKCDNLNLCIGYNLKNDIYNITSDEDDLYNYYKKIDAFIDNNFTNDYFKIELKDGFYEGFYLELIERSIYNVTQLMEAIKELQQIKNIYIDLIKNSDYNMCVVIPGWCTSYNENYEESKKIIINNINKYIKSLINNYIIKISVDCWYGAGYTTYNKIIKLDIDHYYNKIVDVESLLMACIDSNHGYFIDVDDIENIEDYEENERYIYIDNTSSDVENKANCYYFLIENFKFEVITNEA